MKKIKLQKTKTNNTVNLPKDWLELLGAEKGEEIIATFDLKKRKIILEFKK